MEILRHSFSDEEYQRRRRETLRLAHAVGASAVLAFGENRAGLHVTYLSGWAPTRQAWLRMDDSDVDLYVSFHNHVPAARRMANADHVGDVADAKPQRLLGRDRVIATLGQVPLHVRQAAEDAGSTLVSLDRAHADLRAAKSEEEVEALRLGARASDIGARALIDACRPGATDWDLLAEARAAYTRAGARDHICYIGVTNMDSPTRDVPSQVPEGHVLTNRSVVTFELSAAVAPEYPGQILRTVFLGEPTDEYLTLHEVASRAHTQMRSRVKAGVAAQELVDAAACVEESGLATTDDLFHGLGMGYLDPVGVSPSRTPYTEPRGDLRDGMSIVIQPNVTTTDHRAGVQTGQMIIVRPSGFEDLHHLQEGPVMAA